MECFSPIKLKTGTIVPCGRCVACLKRLRSAMSFRIGQELKSSSSARFITLTYSDENLIYGGDTATLVKAHLQEYFRELRRVTKFRYYAIGEYGKQTDRPHYHVCLFNYVCSDDVICSTWKYGNVHLGLVEPASINYMVSDMVNLPDVDNPTREASFRLMSKRPGIGYQYIEKMKLYHRKGLKDFCTLPDGIKVAMPRYYKDKIFSKFEKEMLGIRHKHKLSKGKEALYDEIEKYGGQAEIEKKEAVKRVFNKLSKKSKL